MFNRSPYNTLPLNRQRNHELYFSMTQSPETKFAGHLGLEMPFDSVAESVIDISARMIKGAKDVFQTFNLSSFNVQNLNESFLILEAELGTDLQSVIGLVLPFESEIQTAVKSDESMNRGARLNAMNFNHAPFNAISDLADYLNTSFNLSANVGGSLNVVMPFAINGSSGTEAKASMIKGARLNRKAFNKTPLNNASDNSYYFLAEVELASQTDGALSSIMPFGFKNEAITSFDADMIKGARLGRRKFNLATLNGMSDLSTYFRSAFQVGLGMDVTLNLVMPHTTHIGIKPEMTGRVSIGGSINTKFNRTPFNRRLVPRTHSFISDFNIGVDFDAETGTRIALQSDFDVAIDAQATMMSGGKRLTLFNRSPFNRELTNTKYFTVDFETGLQANTGMSLDMLLNTFFKVATELSTSLIREMSFDVDVKTCINFNGDMIRLRTFNAHIQTGIEIKATAKIYHVDYIVFTGEFKPGDRIIIDSDKFKMTRNGENVSHLYDGDFFDLNLGTNNLTWTDAEKERTVLFRITHRDKFLY